MGISSISEIGTKPSAEVPAAPAVAVTRIEQEAQVEALQPIAEPPPAAAPPPPPPREGFPFDVLVGEHAGSGHRVYDFVDEDSGRSIVQIPAEAVLNLVADVLRQLEAEGLR